MIHDQKLNSVSAKNDYNYVTVFTTLFKLLIVPCNLHFCFDFYFNFYFYYSVMKTF